MLEVKNLTYNINRVALAMLALLEGEVPHNREWPDGFEDIFDTETSTFYNGREKGICLAIKGYRFTPNRLVIVFGENRNSDSIFVAQWIEHNGINPPALSGLTDKAYNERRYFNYDELCPAVDYIHTTILDYCESFLSKWNNQ